MQPNPLPPVQASPDPADATSTPGAPDEATELADGSLSRRGFLKGAALAGGGLAVATIAAACAPTGIATWTEAPRPSGLVPASQLPASAAPTAAPVASAAPSAIASAAPSATPAPSGGPIPAGWTIHDVAARQKVRRYLGDLVPALKDIYGPVAYAKIGKILGAEDDYPELHQKPAFMQVGPQLVLADALQPLKPEMDGSTKVFKLTIDNIQQKIDELLPPIGGFGYNNQWPGPTIRVTEGDRVRVIFTNNLSETTVVHFHGVEFDDFFEDGVAFVTQEPFVPGSSYTYEFTATNSGSLMYHSHHNATDQVGRGLLAAFIVDPKVNPVKYDREYIWISNDQFGGFTINGHGFPATVPVLAAQGETVLVRFMNEGIMMHPWHSHGYTMNVIARDGRPLGSAAFQCDTLGVNPGERWDATIKADRLGVWAFHCHILPHVEGVDGMYGMVNTLMVVPKKTDVDAIVKALVA